MSFTFPVPPVAQQTDQGPPPSPFDYSHSGMFLNEWRGLVPEDAVIKCGAIALTAPGEPVLVLECPHDLAEATLKRWADTQRGALRRWFRSEHPDMPGLLALRTSTELDRFHNNQDIKVAYVKYEPNATRRKRSA